MPNVDRIFSPFVGTGNPDTYVEAATPSIPGTYAPYAGGDLGNSVDWNDKQYQKVLCDSGATAATPAGAVAANQIAYWKDRARYTVTNDSRFGLVDGQTAASFRNNVAGIFRSAVPAGYQCFILQRGRNIPVKEAGAATPGMLLVSDTSVTAAQALGVAIGTAAPVIPLGVVTTATAAGTCNANFSIPNIP